MNQTHPAAYLEDNVGRIPLLDKDGTVRAWATVDPEDVERLGRVTWRLHPKGYGVRGVTRPGGRVETLLLHRAVLELPAYGAPRVGRKNGDRLDNRRANLVVPVRFYIRMAAGNREWSQAGLRAYVADRLAEAGLAGKGMSLRALGLNARALGLAPRDLGINHLALVAALDCEESAA